MNWIGIIGFCYVVLLQFLGIGAYLVSRDKEKNAKYYPFIIFIMSAVPYLMGLFGNDN